MAERVPVAGAISTILRAGDYIPNSLELTEVESGENIPLTNVVLRGDKDRTLFVFLRHVH